MKIEELELNRKKMKEILDLIKDRKQLDDDRIALEFSYLALRNETLENQLEIAIRALEKCSIPNQFAIDALDEIKKLDL